MTDERHSTSGWGLDRRVTTLEKRVDILDGRQDAFDVWRAELRGAFSLVKFALGASVVSALLGIVALVQLAAQTTP